MEPQRSCMQHSHPPPPIAAFLIFSLLAAPIIVHPAAGACNYPALFAFGDSLTDTGNAIRTSPLFFTSAQLPYGQTYFKRAAFRYSDGRLIIDFIAQSIGLPFLNPYLAYKNPTTDFSKGANYAVAGATVQGNGVLFGEGGTNFLTVDNLAVQLRWHLNLKNLASEPYSKDLRLPSAEAYSQGLYFICIGGNDYGSIFIRDSQLRIKKKPPITNTKQLKLIPTVVGKIVDAMETLYANGARNFLVSNLATEGCAPLYLKLLNGTTDSNGCIQEVDQVDAAHNKQLEISMQGLRQKYPDINISLADFFNVYKTIVENPQAFGFKETINACCGAGPGVENQFKLTKICRRGLYVCPNPASYVIWDGIHPTDAFGHAVVNEYISGNYLSPFNALACATPV